MPASRLPHDCAGLYFKLLLAIFLVPHLFWVVFTFDDGITHWDRWVVQTESGYATYSPGVATHADQRGFYVVVAAGLLFILAQILLMIFERWWVCWLSIPAFFSASALGCFSPIMTIYRAHDIGLPWSVGMYGAFIMFMLPALLLFLLLYPLRLYRRFDSSQRHRSTTKTDVSI